MQNISLQSENITAPDIWIEKFIFDYDMVIIAL